jgi:predicted permease
MFLPHSLRRAARGLLRQPGLAAMATLALGFGIGLPTAFFGIVDAAVLRGLPVAEPHRLMHLERRRIGTTGEGAGAAPRDFLEWRAQQRSFTALGAVRTATASVRATGAAERFQAAYVTPNTFAILGVAPLRGRTFDAHDTPAELQASVVIGHHVWRDRFASDPGIVGRTLTVDGAPRTVVGVMPPNFRFPIGEDLWLPLVVPASAAAQDSAPPLDVFGTLRRGVGRDAARAELGVIAQRLAVAYPATNRDMEVTVKPFAERFFGETATSQMYVMLGAVLLVLVVACTNVANLLLVRAIGRAREVAVGVALGATRRRIVHGILLESALLAAIGGTFAVAVAWGAITVLARAFADRLPYWAEPRLDWSVLAFAAGLGVLAALIAGVLPALRATSTDPAGVLRDDSRGATGVRVGRIMHGLVVLELALSMALLVTAALLTRGVMHAGNADLGFPAAGLVTARVALPERLDADARRRFVDEVERRVAADASVASAGVITDLPGTHAQRRRVALDGAAYGSSDEMPRAHLAAASASLFPTLHVAATRGRLFGPQDVATGTPVAIVNERFVARHLAGREPIGQRIRLGTDAGEPWRVIVGVVPNLWMGAFDASPDRNPAGVYVPLAQAPAATVAIVARTRGGSATPAIDAMRAAAFAIDRDVPIYEVRRMAQVVTDGTWFYAFGAGIMGACGLAALLLAAVGVYGVIAFSVGQRRREFGIRMALGATGVAIVRLVLGRGVTQVVVGLVIGTALAALIARGIASLLFDVSTIDPVVFGGVALALAAIAGAAMLVPARRAARGEPVEVLQAR